MHTLGPGILSSPLSRDECGVSNLVCVRVDFLLWSLLEVLYSCSIVVPISAVRRQLELVQRYKKLKESGKLEKYLARKRRRNAQRDRRGLPFKRH